jgi:hypothetical protein
VLVLRHSSSTRDDDSKNELTRLHITIIGGVFEETDRSEYRYCSKQMDILLFAGRGLLLTPGRVYPVTLSSSIK